MGRYTVELSEQLAVLATIDPQSASGELNSDVIDMMEFRRLLVIISVGAIGAAATIDVDVEVSNAVGMTSPVDLTSITQLKKVDTDDNKQVLVEITAEAVAAALTDNDGRYVRIELTESGVGSLVSVVVLGACARYEPASQFDLASVDEIVD